MNALEGLQGLVKQERRVVHEHIDKAHKLPPLGGLLQDRLLVAWTLPQALEQDAGEETGRPSTTALSRRRHPPPHQAVAVLKIVAAKFGSNSFARFWVVQAQDIRKE